MEGIVHIDVNQASLKSRRLLRPWSKWDRSRQDEPQKEWNLRFSSCVLQFIVERDWTIVNLNHEAEEQFSVLWSGFKGKSLRDLLLAADPEWGHCLPEGRIEIPLPHRFLHWNSPDQKGLGWEIHAMECGSQVVLTLVPEPAPELNVAMPQEGVSAENQSLSETIHCLFLRTKQQEARFRQCMSHLPGSHFAQDVDFRFLQLHSSIRELLGAAAVQELQAGRSWLDWVHPNDRIELEKNHRQCREISVPVGCRFRLLPPGEDRVLHLMELRIPVRGLDQELVGYEGLWLDITREALAERRLQQAAWKESLAELSGSLSHDLNNFLTGIGNLIELVFDSVTVDQKYEEHIDIILDSVKQAKELNQSIVTLNREESGEVGLFDLSKLIREQESLIKILLPKDCRFVVDCPEEILPVRLNGVAVRRILINLATNSRDALKEQGEVNLSLRKVDLGTYDRHDLFSSNCPKRGLAAEVSFRDNGCGIDPTHLRRIFGPYFSTKDRSSGSGLGLFIVTQFARENGFDYGVRSSVGVGTEIFLLIPLENLEDKVSVTETELPVLRSEESPGTIGFIGNSKGNCRSVRMSLKADDYRVQTFETEAEVRRWLEEPGGPPKVLVATLDHEHENLGELKPLLKHAGPRVQRILFLNSLDPDRYSDLQGRYVDAIYTCDSAPGDCLETIYRFLDNANSPEGASNPFIE